MMGSARAYLATDPIGDLLAAIIALASIFFQRPLSGVLAQELVPVVQRFLDPRHPVFFLTTWLIVIVNGFQGASRVFLLQKLTVDEYLLWSRVISWPLTIVLFIAIYILINRAARRSARIQAMYSKQQDSSDLA
jgi:hypothetical protein